MHRPVLDTLICLSVFGLGWLLVIFLGPDFVGLACGVWFVAIVSYERYITPRRRARLAHVRAGRCACCGYDLRGSKHSYGS